MTILGVPPEAEVITVAKPRPMTLAANIDDFVNATGPAYRAIPFHQTFTILGPLHLDYH